MWTELKRHPESEGGEGFRVEAQGKRVGAALSLGYRITGPISRLKRARPSEAIRTDELWRTTCLECFVRRLDGGYYEWNLSPSSRWAAYRFDAYREGMADIEHTPAPAVSSRSKPDMFELDAELRLDGLAGLPPEGPWRAGLTAVLEDVDGRVSYWALAHGPGKPDFHHPDSFALDLPPDPR